MKGVVHYFQSMAGKGFEAKVIFSYDEWASPRDVHTGAQKLQICTRLARSDIQSLVDDMCTFCAQLQRFVSPQPPVHIPVNDCYTSRIRDE
jgi:hypothetical protein